MKDILSELNNLSPSLSDYGKLYITIPNPWHGSTTPGGNFHIYSSDSAYCFRKGHEKAINRFWAFALHRGYAVCEDIGILRGQQFWGLLKRIATDLNYKIDNFSQEQIESYQEKQKDKNLLENIYEKTLQYYQNSLNDEIIDWIKLKYDYSDEEIRIKHRLGFAKPGLLKYLHDLGFTNEQLQKTGLFVKYGNTLKEFFNKRVIFPYLYGAKPQYFIARQTEWTDDNKYELAKYKKQMKYSERHDYISKQVNEPIFGIDTLNNDYKKVIIAEGIADAITAMRLPMAVLSPVTVRFKQEHADEFFNLIQNQDVYVCLDNETSKSGNKAADDLVNNLRKKFVSTRKILLPKPNNVDKIDLNDYFKDNNIQDLFKLMDKADDEFFYKYPLKFNLLKKLEALQPEIILLWEGKVDPDNKGKRININKSKVIELISDCIIELDEIITIRQSEEMYFYFNGIWIKEAKTRIEQYCEFALKEKTKINVVNEIIAKIKRKTYKDEKIFEIDLNLICIRNGILHVKTKELIPHNSDYFFISKLPVYFDPDIIPEAFNQFLEDILPSQNNELERKTICEMLGYTLLREYPIPQFLIFNGFGRNGKSTILKLFKEFIGQENVSAVKIHQFNKDFASAELVGKLLNMSGEVNSVKIKDLDLIKEITGGDLVRVEEKYKKGYVVQIYSKLLFANNKLPQIDDEDDAIFERLIVIEFNETFDSNNEKTDPYIIEKITTPNELTGVLNLALEGLETILREKHFSCFTNLDDNRNKLLPKLNSVMGWLNSDKIIMDVVAITNGNLLYSNYTTFCKENNFVVGTRNKFYSLLEALSDGKVMKKKGREGIMFEGINLISLINLEENLLKNIKKKQGFL